MRGGLMWAVGWLGLWGLIGAVWGQEPAAPARLPELPGPVRVTPLTAAKLAMERATRLALSEQQIAAAQAVLRQAEAMRDVQVEGQISYSYSGPGKSLRLPEAMGGAEIKFAPTSLHKETIQVTWPLYLGRRPQYATRAAQAGVEAAEAQKRATEIEVIVGACQSAFQVLRLQQLVVVAEQRLTSVAEHRRIAQAMYEAGTAPQFEVVQAETELARAKGDLIQARTAVAQQKALLRQILVLPQERELIVEEGVVPSAPAAELKELIAQAWQNRPEIAAAEAAIRAQEAHLRLAQANYDPTLALVGQLNNQTESAATPEFNWNIAAAFKMPIYAGREKYAKIAQAEAALASARLNLEQAREYVALQVAQALLSLQNAQEALTVAEQGEREAQERLRIARVRFANGMGLGVEVLDAQTALTAAQTEVISARYNVQVATVALYGALGKTDFMKESAE